MKKSLPAQIASPRNHEGRELHPHRRWSSTRFAGTKRYSQTHPLKKVGFLGQSDGTHYEFILSRSEREANTARWSHSKSQPKGYELSGLGCPDDSKKSRGPVHHDVRTGL